MMELSPEIQLISSILRSSLSPNYSHGVIRSLPLLDHINWDRFIPLTTYHGVASLLLYWLRELRLESNLPRDVHKSLQGIHESHLNVWEDHREGIKKVLMGFHGSEIVVILLKGAQLAHSDYPEFYLRPIGDIDLLVRRSNRAKVMRLMLEMGFSLYETNQTCDKFFIRRIPKRPQKTLPKPIFVEVHSNLQTPIRLNRSFDIDIDELWKGARERVICGFPFLELCPTHNVIYLGAHLGHHYFSRLIWAYDIALLIHRYREEIDWGKLEDLCRRMKVRNPLYHSLGLCQDLFRLRIPETVLKRLSPSLWTKKVSHFLIKRNLLFPEQSQGGSFSQFLIKVLSIDSWLEAMLWFLFPTREWIKQEYSVQTTHEIYPYYFLHPILYLIKAIRTPVK